MATFGLIVSMSGNSVSGQESSRPTGEVAISIADSNGNSVSDVELMWYCFGNAKRFSVADGSVTIPQNRGLVVARREGCAYSGLVLGSDDGAQNRLIMRRPDEPGHEYKTLPRPFDDAARIQAANKIIEYFWSVIGQHPQDEKGKLIFPLLSVLDTDKTLAFFEQHPLDPQLVSICQRRAASAMLKTNPQLAIEIADWIDESVQRADSFKNLLRDLPSESPLRATCESQMITALQDIAEPEGRLAMWGIIGEQYTSLGEDQKAQRIVEQHIAEAEDLPNGGWGSLPRSVFAGLIVNQQPERAMKLAAIEHSEPEAHCALARLAFQCCRQHPDRAIELLNKIEVSDRTVNNYEYHTRVCQWMATSQPAAAIQLAESIEEPTQRAWALGLIARRLADNDRATACSVLEQAISAINPNDVGSSQAMWTPSTIVAGVLPVAERIAPEKIESMIWQSVWLALPKSRWKVGNISTESRIQWTAAAIARYDRHIAEILVEGVEFETRMNPSKAVAIQSIVDVNMLPEMVKRIDRGHVFSSAYHFGDTLTALLTEDSSAYWDTVSLPPFLEWTTDIFEDF